LFTALSREIALGAAIIKPKVRWIPNTRDRHGMANQGKAAGLKRRNHLPILTGCGTLLTEGRTYQADKGGGGKPHHRLPAGMTQAF
jgi:hypothetical protein